MTVKLHLFKGFELPQRGITAETELGYLYSDNQIRIELVAAAGQLGLRLEWIQESHTGIEHFDLWHGRLQKAKVMFPIVSDKEFAADMERIRKGDKDDRKD